MHYLLMIFKILTPLAKAVKLGISILTCLKKEKNLKGVEKGLDTLEDVQDGIDSLKNVKKILTKDGDK